MGFRTEVQRAVVGRISFDFNGKTINTTEGPAQVIATSIEDGMAKLSLRFKDGCISEVYVSAEVSTGS